MQMINSPLQSNCLHSNGLNSLHINNIYKFRSIEMTQSLLSRPSFMLLLNISAHTKASIMMNALSLPEEQHCMETFQSSTNCHRCASILYIRDISCRSSNDFGANKFGHFEMK